MPWTREVFVFVAVLCHSHLMAVAQSAPSRAAVNAAMTDSVPESVMPPAHGIPGTDHRSNDALHGRAVVGQGVA